MWRQRILLAEGTKCLEHTGQVRKLSAIATPVSCTIMLAVALTKGGTPVVVAEVETAAADRVGAEQVARKIVGLDGHIAEDVEIAADVEVKNGSVGFTVGVEVAVDDKTDAA